MTTTTLPTIIPDVSPFLKQLEQDPAIIKMQDKLKEYARVGMKKRVRALKRQIQWCIEAKALREIGMQLLIVTDFESLRERRIGFVDPANGKIKGAGLFRKMKLKNYKGTVPRDILEQLPNKAGKKAYIFEKDYDPIIALKVRGDKYVAVHVWG